MTVITIISRLLVAQLQVDTSNEDVGICVYIHVRVIGMGVRGYQLDEVGDESVYFLYTM